LIRRRAASSDTGDQEQVQMIAPAIGKPKPNALIVARANSQRRFAWGRTSGNDMALLLGAPTSPQMNDEYRLQAKPLATLYIQGMLSGYG
jgi:hypothetical protein